MAELLEAELRTIPCDEFYSVADMFTDPLHLGNTVLFWGGKSNYEAIRAAIPYFKFWLLIAMIPT